MQDDLIVLPYSPLLEGIENEPEDDDDLWFMPMAEPQRPGPKSLPCPACGGQLYAEIDVPGISPFRCLQCRRTIGDVLHSDLERWVGSDGMAYIESHSESLLWERIA